MGSQFGGGSGPSDKWKAWLKSKEKGVTTASWAATQKLSAAKKEVAPNVKSAVRDEAEKYISKFKDANDIAARTWGDRASDPVPTPIQDAAMAHEYDKLRDKGFNLEKEEMEVDGLIDSDHRAAVGTKFVKELHAAKGDEREKMLQHVEDTHSALNSPEFKGKPPRDVTGKDIKEHAAKSKKPDGAKGASKEAKTTETGPRGGTFYVGPSGAKVYVK